MDTKTERLRIEKMFDKAENLRDYPGRYFPARIKAENALKDWQAKYPEEAQAEKDEKEAERKECEAKRAENLKNSFIGQGLD